MYEPNTEQTLERAVNRDLVELFVARPPGDLVLAEWFACPGEDFENGQSALGAVKFRRFEHPAGLNLKI